MAKSEIESADTQPRSSRLQYLSLSNIPVTDKLMRAGYPRDVVLWAKPFPSLSSTLFQKRKVHLPSLSLFISYEKGSLPRSQVLRRESQRRGWWRSSHFLQEMKASGKYCTVHFVYNFHRIKFAKMIAKQETMFSRRETTKPLKTFDRRNRLEDDRPGELCDHTGWGKAEAPGRRLGVPALQCECPQATEQLLPLVHSKPGTREHNIGPAYKRESATGCKFMNSYSPTVTKNMQRRTPSIMAHYTTGALGHGPPGSLGATRNGTDHPNTRVLDEGSANGVTQREGGRGFQRPMGSRQRSPPTPIGPTAVQSRLTALTCEQIVYY
ncbi:hypothetical protein AAG570_007067 [Ranatra chinensis]|uniref:Uncharacterized protein n=1 Tax=Ranatra chinensis TaxID=642074 RepID=A0ABD0XUR2_9HEMI